MLKSADLFNADDKLDGNLQNMNIILYWLGR